MNSGTMPKWQQRLHQGAFGVMCLLLGAFGVLSARFLFPAGGVRPSQGLVVSSLVMVAVAGSGIVLQVRTRRRLVKEFSYDGRALRFSTLGTVEMQVRDLSEIAEVGKWRGRGGPLGYRLRFRDGAKLYLQNGVSNAVAAAEQIRRDRRM
ncbi:MAG: hypothetical protein LAP38_00475 [Acidobacteriia bacterium]|nr:hypothetical protein [Terriglobia bacterium]